MINIIIISALLSFVNCQLEGNTEFKQHFPVPKCRCPVSHVLNSEKCEVELIELTLFSHETKALYNIKNLAITNYTVNHVDCSGNDVLKELSPNQYILLDNGLLFDNVEKKYFRQDEYCLEFYKQQEGVQIVANVCHSVLPVEIPQCCPTRHAMNDNGKCSNEKLFLTFRPWGTKEYVSVVEDSVTNLDCSETQKISKFGLNSPRVFLSFGKDTILHIKAEGIETQRTLRSNQFCVAVEFSEGSKKYEAHFCKEDYAKKYEDLCSKNFCVRKCCPKKMLFDSAHFQCVETQEESKIFNEDKRVITGAPLCSETDRHPYKLENNYLVQKDGNLRIDDINKVYNMSQYCLEMLTDGTSSVLHGILCDYASSHSNSCSWEYLATSILIGVSIFFLAATLSVYLILKDLRGSTNGKCFIAEISSLLIAHIALSLVRAGVLKDSSAFCFFIGSVQYIFLLASFFWLNVMAFDIWNLLRCSLKVREVQSIRLFAYYCFYGFGLPVIIWAIVIIIDNLPESKIDNILRPNLGIRSCFFSDKKTLWAYLYSIICVILVINSFFFGHVSYVILRTQRATNSILHPENMPQGDVKFYLESFALYFKLFVVMGISWIAEILAFETRRDSNSCYVWFPLNLLNSLRGLIIFVIFICKRNVIKKICDTTGLRNVSLSIQTQKLSIQQESSNNAMRNEKYVLRETGV